MKAYLNLIWVLGLKDAYMISINGIWSSGQAGLSRHPFTVKNVGFKSHLDHLWVVSSMVEQSAVNRKAIGSSPILPAMA